MSQEWGILPILFFSLVKYWHSHIEYEIAIVKTWEIDISFFQISPIVETISNHHTWGIDRA